MYLARFTFGGGVQVFKLHGTTVTIHARCWQWHGGPGGCSAIGNSPARARLLLATFRVTQFRNKETSK